MRRLSSVAMRVRSQRERGAVATLIAILLAGGVVIGMLAVSVDLGNIAYERSQVQNGADATSMSLAQECAADASNCDPTTAEVKDLLGANARDGRAQYDASRYNTGAPGPTGVCARGSAAQVGSALPSCDSATVNAPIDDLGECPALPTWLAAESGIPYVETYAATETATGDDELFLPFSRVLAGGEAGDAGVSACARAAWGPLGSSLPSLPIVIGECNWNVATHNGTRFMESLPYSPAPKTGAAVPDLRDSTGIVRPPSEFVTQIFGKVNGSETEVLKAKFPCAQNLPPPSGGYAPGGFGWLDNCGTDPSQEGCAEDTNPCFAPIFGSGEFGGEPGAAAPNECKDILQDFVGQEVNIPVVTGVVGTGTNAVYEVKGVSTFFLAGYHNISNATDTDAYAPKVPSYAEKGCVGSDGKFFKSTCIWGWFTSPVHASGEIDPDGPSRGPVVVKPAG